LVRKGYRVAICDQVEDPRKAKGIVRREVTRVVSPGTFTDAAYLEAREPAFLAAVAPQGSGAAWGLACLDVSTGAFFATEFAGAEGRLALAAELSLLRPKELLVADGTDPAALSIDASATRLTTVEPWTFDLARAQEGLLAQFRVASLAGFGLDRLPSATAAAGAVVAYLRNTQRSDVEHVP